MPTVSTTYAASTQPTWAARSWPRPQLERRQEAGAERVADAGRLDRARRPGPPAPRSAPRRARTIRTPSAPSVVTWVPTRSRISSADQPVLDSIRCDSYSLENRYAAPSISVADQVALAEGQLLAGVGDERVAALAALLGVAQHRPRGRRRRSARSRARPTRVDDRLELDQPGLAHRAGVERRELRHRRSRWCTRTGRCAGSRRCAPSRSRRRAAPARSGSRRSPRRPRRPAPGAGRAGRGRSRCWRRTPPRRISRSSTRKETESLSSCSTTRESANLPPKVIRWSVAMEPAISRDMSRNTTGAVRATEYPIGSRYASVA